MSQVFLFYGVAEVGILIGTSGAPVMPEVTGNPIEF
jgi:hypothetical protein